MFGSERKPGSSESWNGQGQAGDQLPADTGCLMVLIWGSAESCDSQEGSAGGGDSSAAAPPPTLKPTFHGEAVVAFLFRQGRGRQLTSWLIRNLLYLLI